MSCLEYNQKKLRLYRDLLANLSRRNRELYFKETPGSTLNLSKMPSVESQFEVIIKERFRPLTVASPDFSEAIKKGSFDLSDHFCLSDIKNPGLLKRLEKVRLADEKYQREFGISGAWLLGPVLLWRDRLDYKQEDLRLARTPLNFFQVTPSFHHAFFFIGVDCCSVFSCASILAIA